MFVRRAPSPGCLLLSLPPALPSPASAHRTALRGRARVSHARGRVPPGARAPTTRLTAARPPALRNRSNFRESLFHFILRKRRKDPGPAEGYSCACLPREGPAARARAPTRLQPDRLALGGLDFSASLLILPISYNFSELHIILLTSSFAT